AGHAGEAIYELSGGEVGLVMAVPMPRRNRGLDLQRRLVLRSLFRPSAPRDVARLRAPLGVADGGTTMERRRLHVDSPTDNGAPRARRQVAPADQLWKQASATTGRSPRTASGSPPSSRGDT